jgi:Tfp pilus assembly protein PilZ
MSTSPVSSSERRDGPRIDLRLRVRYHSGTVDGEAEASDVSPKGLRLESELPVVVGTEMNLVIDVGGDTDELTAGGTVMWCRERPSPTGRMMYDVGVSFESDWLQHDRGPLGQALARIFAMNAYEPARVDERTEVRFIAHANTDILEVGNLSVGGMQLKGKTAVAHALTVGQMLQVTLTVDGEKHALKARVAWIAGQGQRVASAPRVDDSFGVEFVGASDADNAALEKIRRGTAPSLFVVAV